jgi:hypothetical protein
MNRVAANRPARRSSSSEEITAEPDGLQTLVDDVGRVVTSTDRLTAQWEVVEAFLAAAREGDFDARSSRSWSLRRVESAQLGEPWHSR